MEYTIQSMDRSRDFRTSRHCVFDLHVHLVFVAKYRRKVFTKTIFESICSDFEVTLVEFDGEGDHVHLLSNYPPKVAVSKRVNGLKGVSSRLLRKQNYPMIQNALWGNALWSPSYFASSCEGAPLSCIKNYIQEQKTPS